MIGFKIRGFCGIYVAELSFIVVLVQCPFPKEFPFVTFLWFSQRCFGFASKLLFLIRNLSAWNLFAGWVPATWDKKTTCDKECFNWIQG